METSENHLAITFFKLDSFVWNTNMAAMAFVELVPGNECKRSILFTNKHFAN
jgi:hypothetical protein